ncbi:MAG: hypothetical protein P8R54_27135 [Myxococcota bacterium]|nr:hypothetical protein [Myxococcota bacterium]
MLSVLLACTNPSDLIVNNDKSEESEHESHDSGDSDRVDAGFGLLVFAGDATVGADYRGIEQLRFEATTGGEPLCVIDIPVSSVGVRKDCADCLWAFDLTFAAPVVSVDTHCASIGYDEAAIAAIAGTSRACGFAEEYLGHAAALLVADDGAWEPVSFADWSPESGALSYAWEQGYLDY